MPYNPDAPQPGPFSAERALGTMISLFVAVSLSLGAVVGCAMGTALSEETDETKLERTFDSCTGANLDDFRWSDCFAEGYVVPDPEEPIHENPPAPDDLFKQ